MLHEIEILVNFMTLKTFLAEGLLNKHLNTTMLSDVLVALLSKKKNTH